MYFDQIGLIFGCFTIFRFLHLRDSIKTTQGKFNERKANGIFKKKV
jgi:hypothetical protein